MAGHAPLSCCPEDEQLKKLMYLDDEVRAAHKKREIFDARDPRRAAATPNIHSDLYPTKRKKNEQTRK